MPKEIPIVDAALKIGGVISCSEEQPVELLVKEMATVELVAEFIQVRLQELRLYGAVQIDDSALGIEFCEMSPRQHFWVVNHAERPVDVGFERFQKAGTRLPPFAVKMNHFVERILYHIANGFGL